MGRSRLNPDQAEGVFLVEDENLNNPVQTWTYADEAARLAATGFVVGDKGKLALQESDNTYWVLTNHSPITWVDFSHRRVHSIHGTGDHSDAPLTPPSDGQYHTWDEASGRYVATTNEGGSIAQELPGVFFLGNRMNYSSQVSASNASEIQYTRVWLYKDTTINSMLVFVDSRPNAVDLRMGIYDQTNPKNEAGDPEDRVAQTDIYAVQVSDVGNFVSVNLPSPWVVPATGYYWLAIIMDSVTLKLAGSVTFPPEYLPRREEAGTGTTLPATAGTISNPTSACILVGAEGST